jgi:mannan endo-1,4-beta-mannosidase
MSRLNFIACPLALIAALAACQDAPKSSSDDDRSTVGNQSAGAPEANGAPAPLSTAARPAHNTGTGFFVADGKLYDPQGVEFRIRGVNKLHWDLNTPGIPNTHANTVRWNVDFRRPAEQNVELLKVKTIAEHMVPMPANWDGTCDKDASVLSSIVDTWVAQAETWKGLDDKMILNIANEWGPKDVGWRDAYVDAVRRLRAAGYRSTIAVTAGGCGQNNDVLATYAADVFNADPEKNVIFDQHIYGIWANGDGQPWQIDLKTGLDKLAGLGVPAFVGEFGPGNGIGPSPTAMAPRTIMEECEARSLGWVAWAWDDGSKRGDSWFALSLNGRYDSSADLTTFGKVVVEDPQFGLLALARPASGF